MKKNRTPPITPHVGDRLMPLKDQPPFRPFGTKYEFFGGAIGIDHSLQLYEISHIDIQYGADTATSMPLRDRQVIADYMIALWTAFKQHGA